MMVLHFSTEISPSQIKIMPRKLSEFRSNLPTYLVVMTNLSVIVTAIVSFMTLRQMKTQTEASYRPDLVIKLVKQQFELKENKAPCCQYLPMMIAESGNEKDTAFNHFFLNYPSFEIINVGFGTARFVEMKWAFDGQYYLEKNDLGIGGTGLKIDKVNEEIIQINQNATLEQFHTEAIPYILPTQSDSAAQTMVLSPFYVLGWSSMVYQMATSTLPNQEKLQKIKAGLEKMPPLVLEITYRDIGGEKHEKKFQFNHSAILLQPKQNSVNFAITVDELLPRQSPMLKPYECSFALSDSEWRSFTIGVTK